MNGQTDWQAYLMNYNYTITSGAWNDNNDITYKVFDWSCLLLSGVVNWTPDQDCLHNDRVKTMSNSQNYDPHKFSSLLYLNTAWCTFDHVYDLIARDIKTFKIKHSCRNFLYQVVYTVCKYDKKPFAPFKNWMVFIVHALFH